MQNVKNLKNDSEEGEEILPFSSEYVIDYFDKIEQEFEIQSKKRGKVSKQWKDHINKLIEDCENLRRKYLPKTDKTRVYAKLN